MKWLAAALLLGAAAPLAAQDAAPPSDALPVQEVVLPAGVTTAEPFRPHPLVIAHRGASGERPEETLAAYEKAMDEGADWIEGDVVPTMDGVLVMRHENELSATTDVADHPEFQYRKTTKIVDGQEETGWFAEDFTLAELRTLRARERLPDLRPANARFDGLYPIATLADVLKLMQAKEPELGRPVTLMLELKHPSYFARLGYDLGVLALTTLDQNGYGPDDPRIVIQSFELGALCRMHERSGHKTVLLAEPEGGPADVPGVTYRAMLEPAGLLTLSRCVDALGPSMALVLEPDGKPAPLVAAARQAALPLYTWTLRRENAFLPLALRRGDAAGDTGDFGTLAYLLSVAGVAGIITDYPGQLIALQRREELSEPVS